jgi:hypothetical protein
MWWRPSRRLSTRRAIRCRRSSRTCALSSPVTIPSHRAPRRYASPPLILPRTTHLSHAAVLTSCVLSGACAVVCCRVAEPGKGAVVCGDRALHDVQPRAHRHSDDVHAGPQERWRAGARLHLHQSRVQTPKRPRNRHYYDWTRHGTRAVQSVHPKSTYALPGPRFVLSVLAVLSHMD